MEVEVANDIGAKEGDRIVLTLETGSMLKALFLLYIFPILVMLAGAVVGMKAAAAIDVNASAASVVVAFSALFAAVLFVRKKANQLAQRAGYRPRITRILGR
jgi:sigma-E factor negative regulatory protein RseC